MDQNLAFFLVVILPPILLIVYVLIYKIGKNDGNIDDIALIKRNQEYQIRRDIEKR
jgi:hypothetical protein